MTRTFVDTLHPVQLSVSVCDDDEQLAIESKRYQTRMWSLNNVLGAWRAPLWAHAMFSDLVSLRMMTIQSIRGAKTQNDQFKTIRGMETV